jgi:phage protein D
VTTIKDTPRFDLEVEGSAAPGDLVEAVISITVRRDLDLSDVIEIELSNKDLRFSEGDELAEGKKVSIKLGYVGGDLVRVATGEVVRREFLFPERGPATVTVVAYDKRHALKRAQNVRAWKDVKDSDVVSELAQDAGFSADVDATETQHAYLFQAGITDMAFILERARRLGFSVRVDADGKTLSFKKVTPGGSSAELEWGHTLFSFRPRFTSSSQLNKVTVRGWDPKKKKSVVGEATKDDVGTFGAPRLGAAVAEKVYGARTDLVPQFPVSDPNEAKEIAKAYLDSCAREYARADGACQGNTAIEPGGVVKIKGCGARASGDYSVHAVIHHYVPRGFTTYFEVVRPGTHEAPPPPTTAKKAAPPPQEQPDAPTWVEFELVQLGTAVVEGTKYTVTLPNGQTKEGTVDATRRIRVEGVNDPGQCRIQLHLADGSVLLGSDAGGSDAGEATPPG